MSHEVRRLQALCRGYRVRADLGAQRKSATTIQAVARRYFAINQAEQRRQAALALAAAVERMRSKNAAIRIQRAWRTCVIHQSENEAARIIQRFFIFVKKEVDRELARMAADEKKKKQKKERRRKKKEKDEKLLERVWLTTVDENEDERTRGSIKKTPTRRSSSKKKVAPSTPDRNRSSDLPPPARLTIDADDHTEVSGITNVTFSSPSRFKNMSRQELKDDLSLEEAWIDTEVHQAKEKMRSERDYIKRHGLERGTKRESSSGRKSRPTDSPSIGDNKRSSHRRTGSQSSSRSKGVDPSGIEIKKSSSSTQQRSSSRRQKSSSRTRREAPIEP